jgi:hypothetical protein
MPDEMRERGTVTGVRSLAASVLLENMGLPVSVPVIDTVDGLEMCASMCWAVSIVATVGGEGIATIAKSADERCRRAVGLVVALIDGGEDVINHAVDEVCGTDVRGLVEELFHLAGRVSKSGINKASVEPVLRSWAVFKDAI